MAAIERIGDTDRLFPSPDKNFYETLNSSDTTSAPSLRGREFLRLADAPLGLWSRWTAFGLGPVDLVGRMLSLHRLAFRAELKGELRRADFFWHEAHYELARLCKLPQMWESVWKSHGREVFASAKELKAKLVLEVFADVHAAFANSQLIADTVPSASTRAFVHVQYLRDVLPLCEMATAEQAILLAPALQAQIDALLKARRWEQAVAIARDLFEMAPHRTDFQNRLASTHFNAAVQSLSELPEGNELAEVKQLQKRIEGLHDLRRCNPYNTLAYNLIGRLEYLRAVRLANGKDLPDALVAARKAQIFCPSLESASNLTSQLVELMGDLQKQAAQVEQRLRESPNASLTIEGQQMLAQARNGFNRLEAYLKSNEPDQIAVARQKAEARALWLEIGLAPDEGNWDGRAAALTEVAGSIFSTEPATNDAFAAAFEREASTRPDLAGIDARVVAAFIKRRREQDGAAQDDPPPHIDVTVAPIRGTQFPVIEHAARPADRDREPFGYWLFGHQDYGARMMVIVAAVAVVVVAGSAMFDALGSNARADAYAAIIAAAPQNDDRTVREQGERFLSAFTLRQADARDDHVRALLADAREVPNHRIRDQAVKDMQAALEREDRPGVLGAIDSFAAAPPIQEREPRAAQLRDIYAREFVRWFAGLDEMAGAEATARSETYRRTAAELTRMAGATP